MAKSKNDLPVCDDPIEEIDKILPILTTKAYRDCSASTNFDFMTGIDQIDTNTLAKLCKTKSCFEVRDIINKLSLKDCVLSIDGMSLYIKGDVKNIFDKCETELASTASTTTKEEANKEKVTTKATENPRSNSTKSDAEKDKMKNATEKLNENETKNQTEEFLINNFRTNDTSIKTCSNDVTTRLVDIFGKGEAQFCKTHTGFDTLNFNMAVPSSICEEQHCRAMIMDALRAFPTSEDCVIPYENQNFSISRFVKAVAEMCHLDQTKNASSTDNVSGTSSTVKTNEVATDTSTTPTAKTTDIGEKGVEGENGANANLRSAIVSFFAVIALVFVLI